MSILLNIIEYPDYLTNITSRIIAKIPHAVTTWKILASIWVLTLFYLAFHSYKEKLNTKISFIYIIAAIIGIIGFRFPNLVLPMLNIDEADWAVCAATLCKKSIFWQDVDATTSGPLNIYPLLIIKILGGNINYFTLRLFALLFCCTPTFIFSFLAIKKYTTTSIALSLTVPLAVALALLNVPDLVSFESTYIPMVTSALAYYLLLSLEDSKNKPIIAITLGFVLGLLPFIKLQAVPIGLGIGIWLLYKVYFIWKLHFRTVILILISTILPTLLVIIYIFAFGIQADFWESYLRNNLLYAEFGIVLQEKTWWFKARVPLYLISTSPSISSFFYAFGTISLVCYTYCVINFRKLSHKDGIDLIGALIVFLFSYYSISQPGNICHYYLILIIVPIFFLASISAFISYKISSSDKNKYQILMLAIFLLFTAGIQAFVSIKEGSLGVKKVEEGYRGMTNSPLINEIKKIVNPDDYIAVLGYRPDIYVSSNTLLGIREAQTTRMHFAFRNLQHEYYQERIANDILTNKPKLILDASLNSNIAYPYNDSTTRYEKYPVLRAAVDSNYFYHSTVEKVRIFLKK